MNIIKSETLTGREKHKLINEYRNKLEKLVEWDIHTIKKLSIKIFIKYMYENEPLYLMYSI